MSGDGGLDPYDPSGSYARRPPGEGSWSDVTPAYGPLVPHSGPPAVGLAGYRLPVEHPSGATVLVLGILSLVICPITGIFAITIGNRALREIDASPGAYANRQSVVIGRILGIVAVALYGAVILGYLGFALVIAGMVGLSNR